MIKEPQDTNETIDEESIKETAKKQPKKRDSKLEKENNELRQLMESKESELSALNDKYLRLMAEYDNFKKRTVKEKETIYTESVADTAEKLLPILDNFERAMSAFTDSDKETDFFKGVEMIFNQTVETFTKLGVTPIEALGEEFNPELHNAVMHIEDETVADNIIVEEFQKGYIIGDKVIRYSMVKVAN